MWADGLTALIVPKQLAQGLAAMPCCGLQPLGLWVQAQVVLHTSPGSVGQHMLQDEAQSR